MNDYPTTPSELFHALRTVHPSSPRLSWYGPDSERVEFSGRVLENWVAKTANYLVDELDAEAGTVIGLDLPLHWRSFVWLLASWAVGGTAVTSTTPEALSTVDILATVDPHAAHERFNGASPSPLLVAVALPALQMRWMGDLPPRTLDYCGDVRAHDDVFFAEESPLPADIAWRDDAATSSYADLFTPQPGDAHATAPRRELLEVREGWHAVVRSALEIWAGGGSVVLLDPTVEATEHLRSTENITAE